MLPRRPLGSSGIEVALLGLGGNVFGPPRLDVQATRAVVDAASDLGVDLVDTANVYGQGQSEAILGEVLQGRRDRFVIATKFNLRSLGDQDVATHVRGQAEASLVALRTDRIDLYQLHHAPADDVDMGEVLAVLDALVREGKVRAVGASSFSAWRLAECAELCRVHGWTPFATVQNYWHLLARGIEAEVVPYAARHGIGVLPFHPLGGGYLTGKYVPGQPRPDGTRGAAGSPIIDTLDTPEVRSKVDALTSLAAEYGRTVGELAIAWLACQPVVSSVIAGVSTPAQLALNAVGASWVLDDATVAEVERVVGQPASPERLPYAMPRR
jgi:aryl-alcohol dehydrogenase-like predicted oxidoreductase